MKLVKKFKINVNDSIEILVPKVEDKFNYYYETTKNLHMFDIVTVIFKTNNEEIIVVKDQLNEIITSLCNSLEKTLNFERTLPNTIDIGELGKYYNINRSNENSERFPFSRFWLWSSNKLQAWLYCSANKIYLEITPTYPWLHSDKPIKSVDYITFNEFIKTYKPIVTEEIDHATAQKWLEQCNEILNTMITVQPKDNS